MASLTLYGFEDADGNEAGTYTTLNASEAKEYAQKYGYRVVAMEYEYSDSQVVWEWDYTKKDNDEDAA